MSHNKQFFSQKLLRAHMSLHIAQHCPNYLLSNPPVITEQQGMVKQQSTI